MKFTLAFWLSFENRSNNRFFIDTAQYWVKKNFIRSFWHISQHFFIPFWVKFNFYPKNTFMPSFEKGSTYSFLNYIVAFPSLMQSFWYTSQHVWRIFRQKKWKTQSQKLLNGIYNGKTENLHFLFKRAKDFETKYIEQ